MLAKTWGRRDLTIYGRATLIKTFLLSQFVYLAIPLPKPGNTFIKAVNTLIYHFLWGGGRDKVKREVVNQPKTMGGLDMIDFNSFVISLKVKLVQKILDQKFSHAWKGIVVYQFVYPKYPVISIETSSVIQNRNFTIDLLNCYSEWKVSAARAADCAINQCVWGNSAITDIGSKLWNIAIIQKRIYHLSDFLSSEAAILNYNEFRYKYNIIPSVLSTTDYVAIKLAIKRFNNPNSKNRSIERVDENICLKILIDNDRSITGITSKLIREKMLSTPNTDNVTQLKYWVDLFPQNVQEEICWQEIFKNLYATTNNFKLIQHQYKIFMRIATCRYTRYKMKLESNTNCTFCLNTPETLEHIYLYCPKTVQFLEGVNNLIVNTLAPNYRDPNKIIHFTCYNSNKGINFINLVANWYLGRQFQNKKQIYWDAFIKFKNQFLIGEKQAIRDSCGGGEQLRSALQFNLN